jgi:DNA repair protein RecO (recombination protein O)
VKTDTLRYLRHLQRSQWQTVKELEIPEMIESEVSELIEHYLSYLLERKLNTPEFIRQLQNNQTPPEVNELK